MLAERLENSPRCPALPNRTGPGACAEVVQPAVHERVGDSAVHHVDGVAPHAMRMRE